MGYSIGNERYRATYWRERNGSKIIATELYDEQNNPTETVSLADKPEHKEMLETLAKHLPPVGSNLDPAAKPKGKGKVKANAAPATSTAERGARFDMLDKDKAG
jgi:hypothetical protein